LVLVVKESWVNDWYYGVIAEITWKNAAKKELKKTKTKKNLDTSHVPKCQLPKQHESIGCWSVSLVQQIFLSNKSFLSSTLNELCCNFFPMKEIQKLSMERLSQFDKFNKKIAGSSPFRFSVAVGQKKVLQIVFIKTKENLRII
jgi:hypothetical protein